MLFLKEAEGEENEVEAEGSEAAPSRSKKKPFIIITAITTVLLLLIAAATYFYFSHVKSKENPEENFKIQDVEFIPLQEMNINLKTNKGDVSILRATFFLEVEDLKQKEKIEKFKPIIIDQFQTYLRELDFATLRGSGGLERLRQDLVIRVNGIIKPLKIRNILFKDFLIQ